MRSDNIMNDTYVYIHKKADTNSIFYVGIGNWKRAHNLVRRNIIWKRIYNKHGCIIEILHSNLTWNNACILEIKLIQQYGRLDNGTGILANMTNGGDGSKGVIQSKKQRELASIRYTIDNPSKKKGASQRISKQLKERVYTPEIRKNMSDAHLGHKQSEKQKEATRIRLKGNNYAARLILNIENGIYYDSLTEAALVYNIPRGTLSAYIYGSRKNRTSLRCV